MPDPPPQRIWVPHVSPFAAVLPRLPDSLEISPS